MTATARADAVASIAPSLQREMEGYATRHLLPGVAAGVVVDTAAVWSGASGWADVDGGVPMSTASLCQIASVTKPFTATAIMQLRDAGMLSLDDPVVAHVPELALARNPFGPIEQITVERLLRHTSGLMGEVPNRDPREWTQLEQADVISSLDRVEVLVRPGSVFRYSNLGFRLVAEIVRRAGGRPWPQHAVANILRPLGMERSGAFPDAAATALVAAGYGPIGFEGRRERVATIPSRFSEGDGDLWSNVDELLAWVARQIGAHLPGADDRAVADATLVEMHRPAVLADAGWREARGLGWGALRRDGEAGELVMVTHGGLLDGFNTHVCFSPAHRIGVVAVANALPGGSIADLAWALAAKVVVALGAVPDDAPPPGDRPPPELQEFLGRYHDVSEGDEARIEYLDGALHCLPDDRTTRTRMAPTADALVYRFVEDGVLDRYVTFWRGGSGEIEGVNIGGYPLVKLSLPEARPVAW